MKLRALLASALLLTACSKDSNKPEGSIVPTDLPFNEKALPPISDQDLAQAKLIAKTAGQASETHSQVLLKSDEDSFDKSRRDQDFNRLSPEMQRLVRTWQADCPPNHKKSGRGIEGQPRAGEIYKSTETNVTQGARCPISFSERFDSTISVTEYIPKPLKFGMNITVTGASQGQFNDPAQARIVGSTLITMSFTMTGRFERNGEASNSFTRMIGKGDLSTLDHGPMHLEMTAENLETPQFEKKLTTYRVNQGGKTFVYTQYWEQTGKIGPQPRFFIGNRELTREEVLAYGKFPFDLN